jgi:hypothetical protein
MRNLLKKGHFPSQSLCPRGWKDHHLNHVKNQSRRNAKKVECGSTFMACPRAFGRTKNAHDRQLQRNFSNVRFARSGKVTVMEIALRRCLYDPALQRRDVRRDYFDVLK